VPRANRDGGVLLATGSPAAYGMGQTAAAVTASWACSAVHGNAASSGRCEPSAVIAIAASSRASAPAMVPPAAELLRVTATVTPVLMSL